MVLTAELILLAIFFSLSHSAVGCQALLITSYTQQTSTGNLERQDSSGRFKVGSALDLCVQVSMGTKEDSSLGTRSGTHRKEIFKGGG